MENVMLENLKEGEILLVNAKKVKGGKVQLEFAQRVNTGVSSNDNILALLNEGDDRFNQAGGPRRAWLSAEVDAVKKYFDVDCSDLAEEGDSKELNILNPTMAGKALNMQILETTEPKGKSGEYLVANFEKTAKRAGKDGDFITTTDGKYIYQIISIVAGEPRHTLITDTKRMSVASDIEKAVAASK